MQAAKLRARAGVLYAGSAFFIWGIVPLYFSALHGVSALEIIAHRMLLVVGFPGRFAGGDPRLRRAARGAGSTADGGHAGAHLGAGGHQLADLRLVGQRRPPARHQPGLLRHPPGQRAAGFPVPARTAAPGAVAGAAAGGGRRDEPDLAAGPAPLDRAGAGGQLRLLRPVPQADPRRPHHRPAGRDHAGHPPGRRLPDLPLARGRPPVRPGQPHARRHAGLPGRGHGHPAPALRRRSPAPTPDDHRLSPVHPPEHDLPAGDVGLPRAAGRRPR